MRASLRYHPVRRLVLLSASAGVILTLGTATATHAATDAHLTAAGGSWGRAREVPGTAALNLGGAAVVYSVSCASAGNCSAGGSYLDGSANRQAFVVNETGGTWGSAEEVPGTAALNLGGRAEIDSVSCASAGNCSAGGSYYAGPGSQQAFVVNETGGTWGTAEEVPGTAALNQGGAAVVASVSCASAGNCSAGGSYYSGSPGTTYEQAFVVNETGGTWGTAEEVPGSAALNQGQEAVVGSVSCASAGNCSAGGYYDDSSGNRQAFVVSETGGSWGAAEEVPGSAALNQGGDAGINSVSCASAGNCGAGGFYRRGTDKYQAMVVTERNGAWGTAEEVPGSATLNVGGSAGIFSVSCASAGNCSAGGRYANSTAGGVYEAFVVNETNGTWGNAEEVAATLNIGDDATINSVSCASAGNCSAGGSYRVSSRQFQAFVIDEVNGTWGQATEVAGNLNGGHSAAVLSVSCATATNCSAGGQYAETNGSVEAFVVKRR